MKTLWRVLCLMVFLAGIVSFSRSQMHDKNETPGIEPAAPFVLVTTHYNVSPEGLKTVVGERIRYVKANGEWRQTRYDPSGSGSASKESAVFAGTEEGVFQKAPGIAERKAVSEGADQQIRQCFRSPACLKGQLSFVRNEEIVGLTTFVLRHEIKDPQSPIDWIEESYSPKAGYIALRNVKHFRNGSQMVMEAKKIEFRDVPENLNDDIKAMQNMKEE